jgi:hypothetical protein
MRTYKTITEAIEDLKARGYSTDFNLGFGGIHAGNPNAPLSPDKFEITEVYRFEGESSADDEAVVYAIESYDGVRGVLVNGYGISSDAVSDELIRKLSIKR